MITTIMRPGFSVLRLIPTVKPHIYFKNSRWCYTGRPLWWQGDTMAWARAHAFCFGRNKQLQRARRKRKSS